MSILAVLTLGLLGRREDPRVEPSPAGPVEFVIGPEGRAR